MAADIQRAVQALQSGGIVAIPTDTVYGLAASLDSPEAIEAIYAAKGRESAKALPILVDGIGRLGTYADNAPESAIALAKAFWPGALTIVVTASDGVPYGVHRGANTVGLRMPDNVIALQVINAAGGGLAVTSANLSGESEALTAEEVRRALGGRIAAIVDGGRATGGSPSTVVDLTGRELRILRQGTITLDQLRLALSG